MTKDTKRHDAGDPKQTKKGQVMASLEENRELEDLFEILSIESGAGVRFFQRMIGDKLMDSGFDLDPLANAYNTGLRAHVGKQLIDLRELSDRLPAETILDILNFNPEVADVS